MMISQKHFDVLDLLLDCLQGMSDPWALTGSLGMALQGVPLDVHDIDLQSSADGAYAIAGRLAEYVRQPVYWRESERIRSHFGALEIDGLQVEIMGGVQKRLPDGSWEAPVDVAQQRIWIPFGERQAPVLSLEHEARAYELIGRLEKAQRLREFLQHG
jgi:hypothetical protein